MRKGLFRWWKAELLNLRFLFTPRHQRVTVASSAPAEAS
jgi:hypothetical protein